MKQNHKFAKKALALEKLHQEHEVIFAIKPKNIDKLEQTLKEVSDPNHENYGKYLTRDQIAELTRNEEGNKIVKEYVKSLNLSVQKESEYGDFITVTAPLSSWQTHLKTNFFEFKHDSLGTVHRAESPYELPDHVHQHVVDLFNVNDLPVEVFGGPVKYPIDQAPSTTASKSFGKVSYGGGNITPQSLYRYYNIKPSLGNNKTTQAAIQMDSQIVSTYDLNLFQQYYKLPTQKLARSVGGQVTSSTCPSADYCDEANLDFQYIMAVGRSVATTSIYFDSGWLPIIQNLTSWNSPPKVISISYGSYETSMSPSYIQAFNTLAMQLGVMGTTVVVASGDDGATGFLTRDSGVCMYGPLFPASSPYVLSVGGTMGPEINATEVVSQANLGGTITSGGGFSFYSTIPDYQKTVVTSYLTTLASSSNMIAGYNTKGRGYPDVSAAANNYVTVIGGKMYSVSGTSASAPVVAGMISLINAQRALWGLSSMGFINTYLYTNYAKLATDVKSGNNSCTITGYQCCPQGFPATTGWDAASGLGSLNFTALYNMAVPQTSPAGKPTANTSIADKTGETAGTVFFVLAFVILAGVYALSWLKKPVRDRQASFVPVNHHDDQLDDTL